MNEKRSRKEQAPTPFSRATAQDVRRRIERLGVSNASFARKTGMSANYLNERLREEKSFTLTDVEAMAEYFELDPAEYMASIRISEESMTASVSGDGDTAGIDLLGVLTSEEVSREDLGLAADRRGDQTPDPDQGTQEETDDDDDDARPGA